MACTGGPVTLKQGGKKAVFWYDLGCSRACPDADPQRRLALFHRCPGEIPPDAAPVEPISTEVVVRRSVK